MELVRDNKQKLSVYNCGSFREYELYIVTHLLEARTEEAEKQALLGNGPCCYTTVW
jgi:hypothetical protein